MICLSIHYIRNTYIYFNYYCSLLNADLATASVLISFGAVLGVTTPLQLIVMAICEMAVFATNEHLGLAILKISDVGASILVHVFGAYFGLAVSAVLNCRPDRKKSGNEIENNKEGASYNSDLSAMIGFIYTIIRFYTGLCVMFYFILFRDNFSFAFLAQF